MRRTASAPARWPATRGQPRDSAQRPLPSMMIARCSPGGVRDSEALCSIKLNSTKNAGDSARAHGPDERFHVVEVARERAAAGLGEAVLGARHAAGEGLRALDVVRVLELARVDAQVAVRGLH